MCPVPKPYPKEFRDDVVRIARNRDPGVHLKQIAADWAVSSFVDSLFVGQAAVAVCGLAASAWTAVGVR